MTQSFIKQTLWRQKQAIKRHKKILSTMFCLMFAALAIPSLFYAIDGDIFAGVMAGGSSVMMASMAFIGNVEDSSDKDAAGNQIAYQVWLIAMDQIDKTAQFPQPNKNREIGSIPLKTGEVMHYFEAHDIPTDDSKGEKGDFSTAVTNTFVFAMAGNRDQLLNFIEQYAGGKFLVIYRECESDNYYLLGSAWKPMTLKSFERANNKEKRGITFTFENTSFRQPYKYVGAIQTVEPKALAAGSDTFAVIAGNNEYIIPNGTTAATPITKISGLTDNDKGRTLTLRGTGSDKSATIEDGAVFVLEGGATWTGKSGSSITLRVLDPTRLVEVGGTRIQTV